MRWLSVAVAALVIAGVSSVTWSQEFTENFDSYTAGSAGHGQGGWKGWDNAAGSTATISSKHAFSGKNSAEILGTSDFVHEFSVAGGRWISRPCSTSPAARRAKPTSSC